MRLWVARHAFAGLTSKDPKRERERPLTAEAKKTVALMAETMVQLGEIPKVIFCSPFIRCVQTADIFGTVFGTKVDILGDLAPNYPLESTVENMVQADHLKKVMFVGHVDNTTPCFESLESDDKWKPLVRGEVRRIKIDRDDCCWELKWDLKPSDIGRNDHEDADE